MLTVVVFAVDETKSRLCRSFFMKYGYIVTLLSDFQGPWEEGSGV